VLVQTGLIQASKVSLHRTLGMSTSILGVVLPMVGVWVAIDTGHEKVLQGKAAGESFLLVPFSDMFFFAVLSGLVWWRKRPELHRRLMLLASVSLTVAAFARFPDTSCPVATLTSLRPHDSPGSRTRPRGRWARCIAFTSSGFRS